MPALKRGRQLFGDAFADWNVKPLKPAATTASQRRA